MEEQQFDLGEAARRHYFKVWADHMRAELGPDWVTLWVQSMDRRAMAEAQKTAFNTKMED